MEIPPAPRKVKKYYIKKTLRRKWPITYIFSGMFNVALLFIPIIIAVSIGMNHNEIARKFIIRTGTPVKGVITDFWIDSLITKDFVNSIGIRYTYKNIDTVLTESINTFSITDTVQLTRGENIRIKYLGRYSALENFKEYEFSGVYFSLFIPLFYAIICLPFKIFIKSEYGKYKNVLENGSLIIAKIKPMHKTFSLFPKDDVTVKIQYSYEYGNSIKTDEVFIGKEDFITFKPGEEVNILVSENGLSCVITKEFLWYLSK
jgi:hypothetical protein